MAGVGAQVATPVALPAGYRMVHNTKNGSYEILGSDGVIYVERNGVLKPKAGGNLAELAAAERGIAAGGAKCAGTSLGRSLAYDNPSNLIQSRVSKIQSQIPANSQGQITMGVAVVEDANGVRSVLVSTSEPRGYLRPGVSLQKGEKVVVETGHAEADIAAMPTLTD